MEDLYVFFITLLFLIFGLRIMKGIDVFIEIQQEDCRMVYLENSLLINELAFIPNILFDLEPCKIKKIVKRIKSNELVLAIMISPISDISLIKDIELTEIQLKLANFDIYNTIYILHQKNEGLDIINMIKNR